MRTPAAGRRPRYTCLGHELIPFAGFARQCGPAFSLPGPGRLMHRCQACAPSLFVFGDGLAVVAVDSEEIAPSAPLRRGAISARAAPCLPCAKLTAAPRSGPAGIRQFHRWGVDTPLDIFVALCVLEPINSVEFFLADHSIGIHRWLLHTVRYRSSAVAFGIPDH